MLLQSDAVYMAATDRNARYEQSSCQGAIHSWSEDNGTRDPAPEAICGAPPAHAAWEKATLDQFQLQQVDKFIGSRSATFLAEIS